MPGFNSGASVSILRIIQILFFIFFVFPLLAEDGCGHPDMRLDQGPGADYFKYIPVMNQAGTAYCASSVLSQQFDYYRFKNGDVNFQHQTSPLYMAMDSKDNPVDTFLGWIDENIFKEVNQKGTAETVSGEADLCGPFRKFKKQGSCNRKFIEDDIAKKFTIFAVTKSQERVETYLAFMDMFFEGHAPNKALDLIGLELKTAAGAVDDLQCRLKDFMVPQVFTPDFTQLEEALSKMTKTQFNKEILKKRCQDPIAVPKNLHCRSTSIGMIKGLSTWTIHRLLNKEVPVGLGICESVLYEGHKFNKSTRTCRPKHALLVIGRRSINGRCELLLRNSAGRNCDKISKDWECDNQTGQIWIDQKKLLEHTDAMSSLSL